MKKYILFKTVVILFMTSFAQERDCNRTTWIPQDEKELPKEVCIPKGYFISNIYEPTDVNCDSLPDFIFTWRKPLLQDGDTIFTNVYLQNKDSTFSYFRTFNNLFPIYFQEYNYDRYVPKDEKLKIIQQKYDHSDPFRELSFKQNRIQLRIENQIREDLLIEYVYDNNQKDWIYKKAELHNYTLDTITSIDLSKKIGPSINNFTYFYWEE